MTKIITALIISVVLLHFYFMILEMFLWTKPRGLKTFGLKKYFAEQSKVLAAN
jgi:putative membrane protein